MTDTGERRRSTDVSEWPSIPRTTTSNTDEAFSPDHLRVSILHMIDVKVPADHTIAVFAGATLVNGAPEAHVVVALRVANRWELDLGGAHTGLGDNLAGFEFKYSR